MASRLIVLAAVLVACQAGPIWFAGNGFASRPVFIIREGRAPDFSTPNIAYGFGSGLSYDFGGIKHSTGISASYQSGQGQAYGSGIGSTDGKGFASGVGYANAGPSQQPIYRTGYPITYYPYNGLRRDYGNNYSSLNRNIGNYGTTIAQAQNGNYGSSIAQAQNGNFGTSIAQAQNNNYGTSAATIQNGGRFQSAVSYSENLGGRRNSFSSAQSNDGINHNSAVALSHNGDGFRASTAQATQLQGAALRQAGASSFEAPGIQTSQSHVINNENY